MHTADDKKESAIEQTKNVSEESSSIPKAIEAKTESKKKEKKSKSPLKARYKRNREYLEQAFPAKYIEKGFNATQAYKALKPHATYSTANVEGTKTLAKPSVQNKIAELMNETGLTLQGAMKIHKRNMLQIKHLPTSQKAVETAYELHGVLNTGEKGKTVVNVGVNINK